MSFSGIGNGQTVRTNLDFSLSPDEMSKNLRSITIFESAKFFGQHAVQCIGDHRHDHIEVDFCQDRRRQGIEGEELHPLGNNVFNSPSAGVVTDNQLHRCRKVVRDQKRWVIVAVALDDDLAQFAIIALEGDHGFMHIGMRILPLVMGDVDPGPWFEFFSLLDEVFSAPSQGNKLNPLRIQLREM